MVRVWTALSMAGDVQAIFLSLGVHPDEPGATSRSGCSMMDWRLSSVGSLWRGSVANPPAFGASGSCWGVELGQAPKGVVRSRLDGGLLSDPLCCWLKSAHDDHVRPGES